MFLSPQKSNELLHPDNSAAYLQAKHSPVQNSSGLKKETKKLDNYKRVPKIMK